MITNNRYRQELIKDVDTEWLKLLSKKKKKQTKQIGKLNKNFIYYFNNYLQAYINAVLQKTTEK